MPRKLKNYIIAGSLALLSFLPNKSNAQELNGPTPWEVLENPHSQRNIHMQLGRTALDYWGSGDVNKDEKIDSLDANEIIGSTSYGADVNLDGNFGTQEDKSLLVKYLNKEINYLPGHFNKLPNKQEKENYAEQFRKNFGNMSDYYIYPDWACRHFINQMTFIGGGLSNYENFEGEVEYDWSQVAIANVPIYYVSTKNANWANHSVAAILTGENPLDFNDWYFINYTGEKSYPGDFHMNKDGYAYFSLRAYVEDPDFPEFFYFNFIQDLVKFDLNNGEATLKEYSPWLVLDNPNDDKVKVSKLEDLVLNYRPGLNIAPEVIGKPDYETENTPLTPEYSYRDSVIYQNPEYPLIDYAVKRVHKYLVSSGGVTNGDSTTQNIEVKDIEPPKFTTPQDITITQDQELHPDVTGYPTNVTDNSGLEVETNVNYVLTEQTDSLEKYNAIWTAKDKFENAYSDTQKVNIDLTTALENENPIPNEFTLYQNYPNPFNPTTTIQYTIPFTPLLGGTGGGLVTLKVYDILGNEITTLVNEVQPPGNYSVTFGVGTTHEPAHRGGLSLPSGVYFYRLQAGSFTATKKFILMR